MLHHLQTLVIITRTVAGILVLGLALAVRLAITVGAINPHEALALGLEHGLC